MKLSQDSILGHIQHLQSLTISSWAAWPFILLCIKKPSLKNSSSGVFTPEGVQFHAATYCNTGPGKTLQILLQVDQLQGVGN